MKKYLVLLSLIFTACSIVGPGEKGVRVNTGKVGTETLDSGYYLYIPFVTRVVSISIRVQKTEDETDAATKDMQKITAKFAINWHVNPDKVSALFQNIGDEDDVVHRVIDPAVSEVLKASAAKMTAEEVLTKRIELKNSIDRTLVTRLKTYDVIVDDISLVNLNFTKEFNDAVEAKQIAEQRSKQAEYEALQATQTAKAEVNRAKGEADSNLIRARAQASSQELLRQSLTKDVLQLEYLKKWDGKLPTVLTGNGSGVMLNIPMSSTQTVNKEEVKEE